MRTGTIFHIEDQPEAVQSEVYALIERAAKGGVQLTHLDFSVDGNGFLTIDGMDAKEWVYVVCEMD